MYSSFTEWLDNLLENNDMPEDTKAFNFNLYDEGDEVFSVQLIASDRFDPNDEDWACCEIWSSEEDIFCISASDEEDKSGETFQNFVSDMVIDYIAKSDILSSVPVGIGFVDGDLNIIFIPEN
ncbi:MAG: hypothetical protein K2K66_04465 [Ruminococcus sp.]|nr:hypothetical protein [Ruminococcus sp.]